MSHVLGLQVELLEHGLELHVPDRVVDLLQEVVGLRTGDAQVMRR